MKKTLNINLSGLVFTIDEDAYHELKNYLDTLRKHFKKSHSSDEIMDDIEARIAELMQERLRDSKRVITVVDIDEIINQMGRLEDYLDDDYSTEQESYKSHSENFIKKKLYRDGESAIIGGVCAGVGHYFGIQALWIRLALIIMFIAWGFGVLLYLILWVIVPKANTTTEKLEMKGEPVNISNIGKRVEEELKEMNHKIKNDDSFNNLGSTIGNFLENLGRLLLRLAMLFLKAARKILGIMLLFIGSIATFFLVVTFIATFFGSFINIGEISGYSFSELSELVLPESYHSYFLFVGGFLITVIPVLAILYGGVALIYRYKSLPKGLGWGLIGTWVLGLLLVSFSGITIGSQFAKHATVKNTEAIDFSGDTLYLTLNEAVIKELEGSKIMSENEVEFHYDRVSGIVSMSNINLNVEKSPTDKFAIIEKKSVRGSSFDEAGKRAKGIMYDFNTFENTISFDPFFSFQGVDKYRGQRVRLTLLVPEGKTIYLEPNMQEFIYDIDNITNTYDYDMLGHYWTMTRAGLQSPDFSLYPKKEKNNADEHIEISVDSAHIKIAM